MRRTTLAALATLALAVPSARAGNLASEYLPDADAYVRRALWGDVSRLRPYEGPYAAQILRFADGVPPGALVVAPMALFAQRASPSAPPDALDCTVPSGATLSVRGLDLAVGVVVRVAAPGPEGAGAPRTDGCPTGELVVFTGGNGIPSMSDWERVGDAEAIRRGRAELRRRWRDRLAEVAAKVDAGAGR